MKKMISKVVLSAVLATTMVPAASIAWAADQATQQQDVATVQAPVADAQVSSTEQTPETALEATNDVQASGEGQSLEVALEATNQMSATSLSAMGVAPQTATFAEGEYGIWSMDNLLEGLDVAGGSTDAGANVTLWNYFNNDWQKFTLTTDAEGYTVIKNVNSGLYLGVATTTPELATNVCQVNAGADVMYQWVVTEAGENSYYLQLRDTNLFLDVVGGSAADGVDIKLWDDTACNNRRGQMFRISVAPTRTIADGIYDLASLSDLNENVSIAGDSTDDGADAITMYNLNKGSQKFQVKYEDSGFYSIRSVATGKTLDVVASGQELGTNVTQWTYFGNANQQWRITPEADGTYTIQSRCNDLYLDVEGGQAYDWVSVHMWEKTDNNAGRGQHFRFDAAIDDGIYFIRSADDSNYVADVVASSVDDGANVTLWNYTGATNQKFQIYHLYANYYKIANVNSWRAFDVEAGGQENGTNVSQWSQYDTQNQTWELVGNDDGTYSFKSLANGLYLDVQGGHAGAGVNLQTWEATDNNDGLGQKFTLERTDVNFIDMISEFSTVSSNTENGTFNMMKALMSFDGYVIQPGETMSFFDVAGPCGQADGYLPGGVIGGIGYGGGICQAATTIYGASLRAGLDIVQRNNHSLVSEYVPIGQDAMVNYGTSDLVVRNPYSFPIMIKCKTESRTLICQMWGIQPDWFDYVEVNSWQTGYITASAERIFKKNGETVRVDELPSSSYSGWI